MHTKVKAALETIDAEMFTGDTFQIANERKELFEYLNRWHRKLDEDSDEELPRRKEPSDYDRAQPTASDDLMVREFIRIEGGPLAEQLLHSQFPRKMGLMVAAQFNRGYSAAQKKVREENGYKKGYENAYKRCLAAVKAIPKPLEDDVDDPRG
jgi:hypothetical protein